MSLKFIIYLKVKLVDFYLPFIIIEVYFMFANYVLLNTLFTNRLLRSEKLNLLFNFLIYNTYPLLNFVFIIYNKY